MKIDELNAIKDKMKNQVTLRAEDPDSTKVLVAMGTVSYTHLRAHET